MVSYRDVAGPAALVGAVEGASLVCCGGEIDGVDPYDEEVYLGGGVCRDSEDEEDLKVVLYLGKCVDPTDTSFVISDS